jgi:hypothetical protein
MKKEQKAQKRKISCRPSSFIKKDKIQQKIYSDNIKFMADMFFSYAKK